jgi:long-chain fatty acid transport protein
MRVIVPMRALSLACLCLAAGAGQAQAAGLAIRKQSGAALGNAFAGATAGAEDIGYMFFNPAALARQEGHQVLAAASYIAPRAKPTGVSGSTVLGTSITGGDGGGGIAVDALVPVLYGMYSVTPGLKLGLGVNAPFGLVTEYEDGWSGRYHALESSLTTININPAVAYRMNDMVSVGLGLQAQYAEARLTNAVDFGTLGVARGVPGSVPGAQDGFSEIEGDDWGFGFNAGVLFEPVEGTRLGIAYRSRVSHRLDGDGRFRLDSAGVAASLQAAAIAAGNPAPFVDTGVEADLAMPETVSVGVHHDIDPQWSVMAEAAWTRSSRFDELRIEFDNPAQADSVTEEDWDDSWFLAGGATYRPDADWTIRLGVAYDESPVPDETRTPRIPGADRLWLAVGAGFRPFENLRVDVGYTHIFVDDPSVDLTTAGVGNTFRGNLAVDYDSSIDIVTLQVSYAF